MDALLVLVIWLVLVGLIFYVVWWGLGQIALPDPVGKIVRVVVVVAFVLVLIYLLLSVAPPLHSLHLR